MTARKQELTEEVIRSWVGEQSFDRGERYFRDGQIVNGRCAGARLKADCHGSGGNIYRLHATVEEGKIGDAHCSCPVGEGGHCKHLAAMLLTWLDRPEDFRDVEDTNTALERRSKHELIALVRQMLLRAPELESLLEVPLPTGKKLQRKVNPETYRRQAARAFRGYDYEWGSEGAIASEVSATIEIGDGFLRQGETENAVVVYEAVADEVLSHYEEFHDESGELAGLVQSCVDGLGHCLEDKTADASLREKIMHALFEVYHFDVDFGGVGLSDGVPDLILEYADDAEKKQIAEWVRTAMKRRAGNEWSDNYHRQVYGGFLLQLQADELDDEAYLRLCRESHRLNDLAERLLTLKRVDEASKETARASDYELLGLADIFTQHKQGEIAERLMTERAQTTKDTRIFEWLKECRKKKGDPAGALAWVKKIFDTSPSLELYREVRALASQLGTWENAHTELLSELNKKKDLGLLTEIYLDEKEIDAALAIIEKPQQGFQYDYPDLRLRVAAAAEETRPRNALRLYLQAAERIIEARNRGSYHEACKYLMRVRDLHKKLGEGEAWEKYLQKLKEETRAMRAFKEEMAKAKL